MSEEWWYHTRMVTSRRAECPCQEECAAVRAQLDLLRQEHAALYDTVRRCYLDARGAIHSETALRRIQERLHGWCAQGGEE